MTALTVTTKRLTTHLRTAGPADGEPVIFLLKGPSMFSGYFGHPRASVSTTSTGRRIVPVASQHMARASQPHAGDATRIGRSGAVTARAAAA